MGKPSCKEDIRLSNFCTKEDGTVRKSLYQNQMLWVIRSREEAVL